MNAELLMMGTVMLVFGYLIGVKKMWRLLAGVVIHRAKEPEKAAALISTMMLVVAAICITTGVLGVRPADNVIVPCIFLLLCTVLYINTKSG